MPRVLTLAEMVSKLKGLRLIGVGMVANWLASQFISMKKQVHPGWEYNRINDPTCEANYHFKKS
jgi:hypothetical protein